MKPFVRHKQLNSVDGWVELARQCGFNADEMAKRFGITPRQLERQCKQVLGYSPHDWLRGQRMIAARNLLLEADTVKSVALRLGFKQESHFCREFKRYFEMTPSQFISTQIQRNSV